MEGAGWRAIGGALTGRRVVPAGASGHSWDGPVRAPLVVFLVVSALEVVVVDLLTARWPVVRRPLLVLGVWGVVPGRPVPVSQRRRPHLVGPDGLVVRSGSDVEVTLRWDDLDTVTLRRRIVHGAPSVFLQEAEEGMALHLAVQDRTQVDLVLARPVDLDLPQGRVRVGQVRIAVDDPVAFLAAVRATVGRGRRAGRDDVLPRHPGAARQDGQLLGEFTCSARPGRRRRSSGRCG